MADALSTPVILREIFQHFSSTELLQHSLVNKQWNHEARSLIMIRGNLSARINNDHTRQDLKALAADLQRMKKMNKIAPFSGMNIALKGFHWGHQDWCKKSSTGELDEDYENILDQMTWKNMAVTFNWSGNECEECPEFLLVEKIFKKYCHTLEKLSLRVEYNRDDLVDIVLPGCSFPNLKTFRLEKERNSVMLPGATSKQDTKLIKKLVSTAPNLQILYTEDRVDLEANLLEGSSAVHVTHHEYCPLDNEIPECVVGKLRMQRLTLNSIYGQLNVERFNRITSTLLQNSHATLSWIEMAAIILVPFTRYSFCLEKIRTLRLRFNAAYLESRPSSWRLLKSFDFTRKFPNLNAVCISWVDSSFFAPMMNAFNLMVEEENAAFVESMPDRAANIKSLSLPWPTGILDSSTDLLAQMFPDIQKLSIRAAKIIPFARIWDSWGDLKELDITLRGCGYKDQFDGAICGIFPEEVAQLQDQDEEYLRRVNIVPVMPSITCLKGLKTLNLYFVDSFSFSIPTDDPTFMFSKVTGLVALQRSPALNVNLATNNPRRQRAMSHLLPYASVVLRA